MKFTRDQVKRMLDRLIEHPEEIVGLFQFFTQVTRDEFDVYNQKLPTRHEIRQEWFATNFTKRPNLEINKPEFAPGFGENAIGYLSIKKQVGKRIVEAGQHKFWLDFFHADNRLDQSHTDTKQPLDRPQVKPSELIKKQAEVKRENEDKQFWTPLTNQGKEKRRQRKLTIARVMASGHNPTNRAIERYKYLLECEANGFKGLPSHYTRKLASGS